MAASRKTLLCLGDSHTEGVFGTDWVGRLTKAVAPKHQVVRSGISGQWAVLIGQRLKPLLNQHPDAAGTIILAGTNDVLASISIPFKQLHRNKSPDLQGKEPSLQLYEETMDTMLSTLSTHAPNCRAAILTLPPIGEDLDDVANRTVVQYNAVLKRLVEERYGSTARLVDFHAACVRYLGGQAGRKPPPLGLQSWWPMVMLMGGAVIRRFVLRQGWDSVARANGLLLLTDQVHLDDTAGAILLETLQPWVDEVLA